MTELVVLSGKGGTGKTSITASLALLAQHVVVADCDVDAANLHLLLQPRQEHEESFKGGFEAFIDPDKCRACGRCYELCRYDAIEQTGSGDDVRYTVGSFGCEGCGVCFDHCPHEAIRFAERLSGVWYRSAARTGPMVHARLEPGGENSGKLVAQVKQEARRIAEETSTPLLLVDGPPGIGCPAIASLSGATHLLAVTEPSLSGLHDLERLLELAGHFHMPVAVCINRFDISIDVTTQIEEMARAKGALIAGRIAYDRAFPQALVQGRAVVEDKSPAAEEIRDLWRNIENWLEEPKTETTPGTSPTKG